MKADVRHLLAGYATGTLSETERKALFEAALHDPELFAEIANDEPLRNLLASPQARAELLERIEPAAPGFRERLLAWLRRPPVLAGLGTAAVATVIVTMIPFLRPTHELLRQQQEIAKVSAPPPVAAPAPAAGLATAPLEHKPAARTFKAPSQPPARKVVSVPLTAPAAPKAEEPTVADIQEPPAARMVADAAPPPPVQYEVERREGAAFVALANTSAMDGGDVIRVRLRPSVAGFLTVRDASVVYQQPLFSGQVAAGKEVTAGPVTMDRDHTLEVAFTPLKDAGTPVVTAFRSEAEGKTAATVGGPAPRMARKSARLSSRAAAVAAPEMTGTITFPIELRRKP